ncbi:MAG: sigma-54 dependent transcriptional regulator [Gammaproteobacteria bacterium]|jgi:DNA-binding NtrC family response regulator
MNNDVLKGTAILIVSDNNSNRQALQLVLDRDCGLLETATSLHEAEQLRKRCYFDLIVAEHQNERLPALSWLQSLQTQNIDTNAIVVVDEVDHETALAALKIKAHDLIKKPFNVEEIKQSIVNCLEERLNARNAFTRRPPEFDQSYPDIVGQTAAMESLGQLIKRVAGSQSTVLVQGETGTGKELVAKAIHEQSGRKGPFVPINCGSVTAPDLLESELFGHTKGAFTGAHTAREGLCFFAKNGTLFLDEIGEMPVPLQANLLRMLEQRAIRPVGSEREISVDCRVIAATNRNLATQVTTGKFREDLFYRLNVFSLEVPPLRNRREDIPLLARYFLTKLSSELGIESFPLTHSDINRLQRYDWPGNVRELRNIMERSLLLGKLPAELLADDLRPEKSDNEFSVPAGWTLHDVEKQFILRTLQHVNGNKSEAARRMGVSRKTVERKLNEWNKENEPLSVTH